MKKGRGKKRKDVRRHVEREERGWKVEKGGRRFPKSEGGKRERREGMCGDAPRKKDEEEIGEMTKKGGDLRRAKKGRGEKRKDVRGHAIREGRG